MGLWGRLRHAFVGKEHRSGQERRVRAGVDFLRAPDNTRRLRARREVDRDLGTEDDYGMPAARGQRVSADDVRMPETTDKTGRRT